MTPQDPVDPVDPVDYAPGWGDDALAMLGRRTADERAGFALPLLGGATRIADVGCGPGAITLGLARALPAARVLGVDRETGALVAARAAARAAGLAAVAFAAGSALAPPLADGGVDAVFAHALLEHLPDPAAALVAFRRAVRPGGVVAVSSSDWSGARAEPYDADVEEALAGHRLLRRRAGGDPFAGGRLAPLATTAGLVDVTARDADREDMAYDELARYVGARLRAAARAGDDERLRRAAAAADRWAGRRGRFTQRWVEVTARVPSTTARPGVTMTR